MITFEEEAVSVAGMQSRIDSVQQQQLPYLVVEQDGDTLGYAYATPWRTRLAYRYSVETTVYLHHAACGRGFGKPLYQALLQALRERGMHCAIGGIAQPNAASVALHERLCFVHCATFQQVGRKFGSRVDVAYWQLML